MKGKKTKQKKKRGIFQQTGIKDLLSLGRKEDRRGHAPAPEDGFFSSSNQPVCVCLWVSVCVSMCAVRRPTCFGLLCV